MQFRSAPRHTLIALLGAAGLVAGSGVAAAQFAPAALPGTNDTTIQFAVGTDLATVTVDDAGANATEVTGTFTNDSDEPLYCVGANLYSDADGAGTVTEAPLVARSLAYLTNNVVSPGGIFDVVPGLDPGSLGAMLGTGSLGSLGLGDPAAVELDEIQKAQDQERLDGHYGTVAPFAVDEDDTVNWTATLTVPTGGRTDFNAGALFTCVQDEQWYAFAGYEEVDDDDDNGGSLSMGSLGS